MLFNSYAFIFAFLPVSLVGYFVLARWGKGVAAAWLAACSVFFYGYWDVRYVPLLLGSICGNFAAGGYIAARAETRKGRIALAVAVAANLALLAYYKYADFLLGTLNATTPLDLPLLHVVLPIGISFFTFTQIAFLADAYVGKVREYRFVYYVLFVTYFPHLVAGPVLHHKEMMPQFDRDISYVPRWSNFAVGFTIFAIGLAKKVLIADQLAPFANPVFEAGAPMPTLIVAWGGVLAYTFQLYFDFSGYSDMAIGLARLFGVRLPLNFASPYKASNISEFWRRWHMTLSRFLRDYLYIPLGGNRKGEARRLVNLMVTMLLGGLWHGAGWTFVIWGGLHGSYLIVHQLWQRIAPAIPVRLPASVARTLGVALTFLAVVAAWVYFRAPNLAVAHRIFRGLAGANGVALPDALMSRLGPVGKMMEHVGVVAYGGGGSQFALTWLAIVAAAVIAFAFPNTQQIMRRARPALGAIEAMPAFERRLLTWRPSRRWAWAAGCLAGAGVLALARPTDFLYFQF